MKLLLLSIILTGAMALAGCEQGPAENAGERLDEAVENTGDAVENAAEDAAEAVEDAADSAN